MQLGMTYRIVSQSSPVQSSSVMQSVSQSVGKSIDIKRLGNIGFTTISLSSNVKNSLGMRHSFYAIICYNDIKYTRTFCKIQSFTNIHITVWENVVTLEFVVDLYRGDRVVAGDKP